MMNYFGINRETLVKKYEACWTKPEDVPEKVYRDIFESHPGKRDYYTPLAKGKEWLFELTCRHQPRTGQLLMEGGELLILMERFECSDPTLYSLSLALEVRGKIIALERALYSQNPSDPGYADYVFQTERYVQYREKEENEIFTGKYELSFPVSLTEAYYTRFQGMTLAVDSLFKLYGHLLPRPTSKWVYLDDYFGSFRGYKKKYLPWLKERIPGIAPRKKDDIWLNFVCFLYVQWGMTARESDALFVKNHIQDGVIYHVRDGDIQNMSILAAPEEAIDRYCEHILLEKEGRFDFRPYTIPWDVTPSPDLIPTSQRISTLPPSLLEEGKNFTVPPPPSAFGGKA